MNKERVNQLTTPQNYDVKRMVFSDPVSGSVPNSNPPVKFRRINISTMNKDGSIGDLIIPTERLFSFGVSENKNQETGKVNGHVLPICCWNREGATQAEKTFTDTLNKIVECCKNYLIDNKDELELYDLTMADLKKIDSAIYWKKEKGKVVEGTGPTLYAKLIESKKNNKILSMFFNEDGDTLDPLSLMGQYCHVTGAVKVESIFLGNKITLQIKLYEATVALMNTGIKPLLSKTRSKTAGSILRNGSAPPLDEDDEEPRPTKTETKPEPGSVENSDAEDVSEETEKKKPEVKKPPVKPVRKLVKKV